MADNVQQPTSPRLLALQNLAGQLPVANSRIAQGQQAARDMQLQAAVAKAPASSSNITRSAQDTGAQVAQNVGTQMVQNAQQQIQQQGQVGQLGNQEQQQINQAQVFGLQQGAREQAMDNVQKLASISQEAKQELYDQTMQLQKDEAGRTFFNERQLADYARLNAQSDEDFKNKAQQAEQVSKRNLQAMETAYNLVQEDLNQRYDLAKQRQDQATMKQIQEMKIAADRQMTKERNRAANNAAAWQAGGTIVGAVAGSFIPIPGVGTAAGAMMGASLGGAAGGIIGSQTS